MRRRTLRSPSRKFGTTKVAKAVSASFDALEPAVDIPLEDLRRVRQRGLEIARSARHSRQRSRAIERLLPVGSHDRSAGASAHGRITSALPVLLDNARASLLVSAWAPWNRFDNDLDVTHGRYGNESEAEKPA